MDPIEGQIFNLKLKERFRDKVRYVFLQGTQYSREEVRFLQLPPTLSFLYIFVRPIWLLRRYGFSVKLRHVAKAVGGCIGRDGADRSP